MAPAFKPSDFGECFQASAPPHGFKLSSPAFSKTCYCILLSTEDLLCLGMTTISGPSILSKAGLGASAMTESHYPLQVWPCQYLDRDPIWLLQRYPFSRQLL